MEESMKIFKFDHKDINNEENLPSDWFVFDLDKILSDNHPLKRSNLKVELSRWTLIELQKQY